MSAYSLLSKTIQKKVYDLRWEAFTPIQELAIPNILNGEGHVVLSAATASGKTEAAFLPVLTAIEKSAVTQLKVLYISPLKALINDQYDRIHKLCEGMNIEIQSWHGDISQYRKKKFTQSPAGILQITPESLESLFVNRKEYLVDFFSELEFVIIDEIHSFMGQARGVQLRSLISRLALFSNSPVRIIGLSATLGAPDEVKKWCGSPTEILEDTSRSGELLYSLMHFPGYQGLKPRKLYEDILDLTAGSKAIVFCNSRAVVEEVTIALNDLAGITRFLAHHSSIDKNERLYVEGQMRKSRDTCIVATSSLELGIDIGDMDMVIQIDSTHSVSSLRQRLGRAGRRQGAGQVLQLYSTNEISLIKTVAGMELLLDGWSEPASGYPLPYDVLFQQLISICAEHDGISYDLLLGLISQNAAFKTLEPQRVADLVEHMVRTDFLERIDGRDELIIGLESAKLLKGKTFYSVFSATEMYDVFEGTKKIGQLEKTDVLMPGDTVMLGGRMWLVTEIDDAVHVQASTTGQPPKFEGGTRAKIADEVAKKMYEVLISSEEFDYLDGAAAALLAEIRENYKGLAKTQRPIFKEGTTYRMEFFAGTQVTNTLVAMMRCLGVPILERDGLGRVAIRLEGRIGQLLKRLQQFEGCEGELLDIIRDRSDIGSRYFEYLPIGFQDEMLAAHELDVEKAKGFLMSFKHVIIHST